VPSDSAKEAADHSRPASQQTSTPQQTTSDQQLPQSDLWSLAVGPFTLQERGRCFMLEVFSGSSRLTACLRKLGHDAWGIDHRKNRFQPLSPAVLDLDLTEPRCQKRVPEMLGHPALAYVHMAPPCGTSSLARSLPIAGGGPKPLRSSEFPRGLPGLEASAPRDFARVSSANALYDFCVVLASKLSEMFVAWSIENPANSIMWDLPGFKGLLDKGSAVDVLFAHCEWGGTRPKRTRWRCFPPGVFEALGRECSGNHTHEPWGKSAQGFVTADEAAYPEKLCSAVANLVSGFLDHSPAPELELVAARPAQSTKKTVQDLRVAAGTQPRGAKHARLLPEFASHLSVACELPASDPRLSPGHTWVETHFPEIVVPKGSRTIRTFWKGGAGHDGPSSSTSASSAALPPPAPTRGCLREIGPDRLGSHDLYIGREHRCRSGRLLLRSPWANPFRVADSDSTLQCIEKFRQHLVGDAGLMARIPELAGRRLVCHCAVGSPCHGDVLISLFRQRFAPAAASVTILVGVYATPAAFVAAAAELEHPFEALAAPRSMLDTIEARLHRSVRETAAKRQAVLGHWRARKQALEVQEAALHKGMNPEVAAVMAGKPLLLFREMLASFSFPKSDVLLGLLAGGFPLAGEFPRSDVLPTLEREPSLSVEDLWRSGRRHRAHLLATMGSSGDPDVDRDLWEATQLEVEKGWLRGPFRRMHWTRTWVAGCRRGASACARAARLER